MRILRELSLCHHDQLLDILLNLVYACSGRSAKVRPGWGGCLLII